MRVGIFLVSASVACAGVAFAQSDWVVDPWSRPTLPSQPQHRQPVARAAGAVPVEWLDERNFELTDPWQSSTPSSSGTSAPSSVTRAELQPTQPRRSRESGEWATAVPLLVDPWAPESTEALAPGPELIVDPRANDVPGP